MIPLVLGFSIALHQFNKGYDETKQDKVKQSNHIIVSYIDRKKQDAIDFAKEYARQPDVVSAASTSSRVIAQNSIVPIFENVQAFKRIDVFTLTNDKGDVIVRSSDLQKYGDNKGNVKGVRDALNGKDNLAFETTDKGVSIRASVPVKDGETVVGVLQIGFYVDEEMVKEIKSAFNSEVEFFKGNELMFATQGTTNKATTLNNDTFKQVNKKETVVRDKGNTLDVYYPIGNAWEKNAIGTIHYSQDVSKIKNAEWNATFSVIIVVLVFLILVLVVGALISNRLVKPIDNVKKRIANLASNHGDLTQRITVREGNHDEIDELSIEVNRMLDNMQFLMKDINQAAKSTLYTSEELASGSEEIFMSTNQVAEQIQRIAESTDNQNEKAERVSQATGEMAEGIIQISKSSEQILSMSKTATQEANEGEAVIQELKEKMKVISENSSESSQAILQLNEKSKEIEEIVNIITDISGKTNLLSLNASIEAARAGEAGKGFAVVGEEVRKLAEQSALSAKRITHIIHEIKDETTNVVVKITEGDEHIKEGEVVAHKTGERFKDITHVVNQMEEKINNLVLASAVLAKNTDMIAETAGQNQSIIRENALNMQSIAAMTEEQNASMHEIVSSTDYLNDLANTLKELISKFRV